MERGKEPDPDRGPEADTEPGPQAVTGSGPQAVTGSGPQAGTGPGPQAVTEPGPEAGAGAGPEAGTQLRPEIGVGSGAEAGTGPGPGPEGGTQPGSEAGAGAGAELGGGGAAGGSRGRKRGGWGRRARRGALLAVLVLFVPLLIAETALRVNYTGDPEPGARTRDKDALWLGHAWVDGRKGDADVTALAARLAGTGIRDLYVHAGPLEHNGTLPTSAYPKARWLITAVHRKLPGVRVQAWLGDEIAPEKPGAMHLERKETRAAVVASARQVVAAGFDGVHFDLEPLHSGDRNYLALLEALRPVTPLLSVAAHQIDPLPAFHSFWGTLTGHPKWWSQEYFGQVARRVDQIAVMSYDTMQPLESLYGGYVAQQTSLAIEVTPAGTDLLMGLPFYHENRFGHWAHAETVPAAVRGVRLGLSRADADRANFGVALYVDFAATEDDWTSYRKDWVRTP